MESGDKPQQLRLYLIILLGGGGFILLCLVCLIGGILWKGNILQSGALTRTALVQLFETPVSLLPSPSDTGITTQETGLPSQIPRSTQELPTATPSPTLLFTPPIFFDPPKGIIVYTCFVEEYDQICIMN